MLYLKMHVHILIFHCLYICIYVHSTCKWGLIVVLNIFIESFDCHNISDSRLYKSAVLRNDTQIVREKKSWKHNILCYRNSL